MIFSLGPFGFPIRTHLKGFFRCGASTFAPGIHGVTTSGLAAAAAMLDCREDDLLTETEGQLHIYPADEPAAWPEKLRPHTVAA